MEPNDTLAQLGIKLSTLISGFSGGLFHYYLEGYKFVKRGLLGHVGAALTAGFMGSLVGTYVAPIGLLWFSVDTDKVEVHASMGFLLGVSCIYIGRGIVKFASNWAERPTIPPRG